MNVEKAEEKRDYNPFEHRQVKKPTSDIRSAANLIKASLGSGLLAGPLAFANAGWGVGLFGTLLVGVICGHCIHILVKTSQQCCVLEKKPSLGYAETCKAAFMNGPKGMRKFATFARSEMIETENTERIKDAIKLHKGFKAFARDLSIGQSQAHETKDDDGRTIKSELLREIKKSHVVFVFAEFALLCTYAGVCCIYTVLISDSVKQLVDRFAPSTIWPVEYYCLIILVPIILLCQIRYLKFLAIFSGIANILLFTVYIVCLYYIFGGDISFEGKHAAGDPARYPAFLSTVIFAMEGVGVVMPIENTMKKPQNFLGCPSVLVVAMTAIVFLYGTLGMFGYLRYGDVLRGSITLNLPTEEWPAVLAKVSIALSIFLTYPLQFYVVIDIFTRYTQHHIKENYRQLVQIVARTVGVCACVGIGMALPLLEQILNIVGALFYSILGLIIPSVIETVFRWENLGKWNWILWKNLFIGLFGLLSLVSGCTVTIMDIIEILHRKTE